jgi:hypothetical protein
VAAYLLKLSDFYDPSAEIIKLQKMSLISVSIIRIVANVFLPSKERKKSPPTFLISTLEGRQDQRVSFPIDWAFNLLILSIQHIFFCPPPKCQLFFGATEVSSFENEASRSLDFKAEKS